MLLTRSAAVEQSSRREPRMQELEPRINQIREDIEFMPKAGQKGRIGHFEARIELT